MKRELALVMLVVTLAFLLFGCKRNSDPVTPTQNTQQSTTSGVEIPHAPTLDDSLNPNEGWISDTQLYCEKIAVYSGQFVEDSSDRRVENVAVMLISNRSDRYLDIAMLTYEINDKTAHFTVTGLPAGKSAWVLESDGLQITENPEIAFVDSVIAYRDEVVAHPEELTISSQGNSLRATNNSDHTLYNVYVYYKALHTDGYYLGGITYGIGFGDLQPGQSADSLAGHYKEGKTEIIRVAWLDEPLPEVTEPTE